MRTARHFKRLIQKEIQKKTAGGRRRRQPRPHTMAVIDSNYVEGRPLVVMEDDPSDTPIGPYPYLNTYTPVPGDRVLMAKAGRRNKYVILGRIE